MSDRLPENLSDRMSDYVSKYLSHRMPKCMSFGMPESNARKYARLNSMPESTSDRRSEYMSSTMSVGGDHSRNTVLTMQVHMLGIPCAYECCI